MAVVSVNDDYACLNFRGGGFYYGYEVSKCMDCGHIQGSDCECEVCGCEILNWCFQAKIKGKSLTIPASDLNVRDGFNCAEALLAGIGKYMEQDNG